MSMHIPEPRDILQVLNGTTDDTPQRLPGQPPRPAEMTEEELQAAEPDVVEYLFRSVDRSVSEVATLELKRFEVPQRDADGHFQRDEHGRLILGPLCLRVHALYQRDIDQLQRRTRRVHRRDERGRDVQVADPVELACRTIEVALVPEDRELLNDHRMRDRFQAGDVAGVIANLLYAGEAIQAANLVRRISRIPLELRDEDTDLLGESSSAEDAR
jgi:hypothetical protein